MKYARALAFAALAGATIISAGCSVARDQQTMGSYVDDAGITTAVKAKMAEDKAREEQRLVEEESGPLIKKAVLGENTEPAV